jgi:hypothetical protein
MAAVQQTAAVSKMRQDRGKRSETRIHEFARTDRSIRIMTFAPGLRI